MRWGLFIIQPSKVRIPIGILGEVRARGQGPITVSMPLKRCIVNPTRAGSIHRFKLLLNAQYRVSFIACLLDNLHFI